jgi:chitin deacetylase
MVLPVLPVLLFLPLLVLTHPSSHPDGSDWGSVKRALPSRWYQERGHPVERLFNRQDGGNPDDGVTYPTVGTAEWAAAYPPVPPDSTKMPAEWADALNQAVAAGKIPDIPLATTLSNGTVVYPNGANGSDPSICSGSFKCMGPEDIWNSPDGVLGVSFDDGPYLGSDTLYAYLEANDIPSTHFMIGINIVHNPSLFIRAYEELGCDIAVHTWSHHYMTTLSNLDAVAELGWTMEIIKNSTVSTPCCIFRSLDGTLISVIPRVADYRGTGVPRTVTSIIG